MPIDLVMGFPIDKGAASTKINEYIAEIERKSSSAYRLAREHLRANAERRKTAYDIRCKGTRFSVEEWVWYWYPRRYRSKSIKWQQCYTGPYLIVRLIEPVNCVLQHSSKSRPFVVHFEKLKKCYAPMPVSWLQEERTPLVEIVFRDYIKTCASSQKNGR